MHRGERLSQEMAIPSVQIHYGQTPSHTKTSGAPGGRTSIPALDTSLQWLDTHIKHGATTTNITVSQVEVSNGGETVIDR